MLENEIQKNPINEIIQLHNEIGQYLKMSLDKAIRIGELLTEQKASLKHGDFTPWIESNLPFTDRTARNYMRIYQEKDQLKSETVSDLKSAYKLLSTPKRDFSRFPDRLQSDQNSPLPGLPDGYHEREKVVLYKEEEGAFLVCLALGPNKDHPYIETADFRFEDMDAFKGMTKEELFDRVMELHGLGIAYCLKAGTWGNYLNPKMEIGGQTHFIKYSPGNRPKWFQSGLEHRIPQELFTTDISFIEQDPRTPEEKARQKIEAYEHYIEKHQKEIEKLEKKIRGTTP